MSFDNITIGNLSVDEFASDQLNSSSNYTSEDYLYEIYFDLYEYCNVFDILVSVTILVYGSMSWTLLPRWRNYKNYIFLNVTLAGLFKHMLEHLINYYDDNYSHFIYYYTLYVLFIYAHSLWMLIMSSMFYSSVVKIFKPPKKGRFKKSALVGWGLSFCLCLLDIILSAEGKFDVILFTGVPSVIQLTIFVMYMTVLWNLLKGSEIRRSNINLYSKIQLATLLLFMSGITTIACQVADAVRKQKTLFTLVLENIDLIPNMIVCMWVTATKSSRQLWMEYYRNKVRKRNVNNAYTVPQEL